MVPSMATRAIEHMLPITAWFSMGSEFIDSQQLGMRLQSICVEAHGSIGLEDYRNNQQFAVGIHGAAHFVPWGQKASCPNSFRVRSPLLGLGFRGITLSHYMILLMDLTPDSWETTSRPTHDRLAALRQANRYRGGRKTWPASLYFSRSTTRTRSSSLHLIAIKRMAGWCETNR